MTSALLCAEAPMIRPHVTEDPGNSLILPGVNDEVCDTLAIALEKIDGAGKCLVIRPHGQIDAGNLAFFERSMMKAVDSGFDQLILVLSGVKKISRTALRVLAEIRKSAASRGVDIWSMSSRGPGKNRSYLKS
jgi:anti-anti-sigma factor